MSWVTWILWLRPMDIQGDPNPETQLWIFQFLNPPATLHLAEVSLINAVGSCMGKNLKGNDYENPRVTTLCVSPGYELIYRQWYQCQALQGPWIRPHNPV